MVKRICWILFIGGCSFVGGLASLTLSKHFERAAMAQPPAADAVAIGERFESVAKRVSPAVVYVESRKPEERSANGTVRTVEESGSGVIARLDGRRDYVVLTNHHVIADTDLSRIMVQLADGRVLTPARAWSDRESDVAILSLEGVQNLPTAPLGDSDKMRVGNWVLAIGSPFGLNQTVTHGIVSARERGQISLGSAIRIKDFLQTDAAINPGSSGGPLVNLNGEVIGINTAIASPNGSNSGIAFSIPINLFKRIMSQLLDKGAVARGYLGVQLSHSFEPAEAIKLGLDRAQGALVEVVFPGTPAASAGLKAGDVVLEVDQQTIRNENHLINHISGLPAGRSVKLLIWRERRQAVLTAVVGDWSKGQDKLR